MTHKYGAFKGTTEDRMFMTMYFNNIISGRKFKQNLKKGIKNAGPKNQEFDYEINKVWQDYLIETGRANPKVKANVDKWSIANTAFNILKADKNIIFKLIDPDKRIGAIIYKDTFFEVRVVGHKKPQTTSSNRIIGSNLTPFIENLVAQFEPEYTIVIVKNNQITVEDTNHTQTSIKITKKKTRLF